MKKRADLTGLIVRAQKYYRVKQSVISMRVYSRSGKIHVMVGKIRFTCDVNSCAYRVVPEKTLEGQAFEKTVYGWSLNRLEDLIAKLHESQYVTRQVRRATISFISERTFDFVGTVNYSIITGLISWQVGHIKEDGFARYLREQSGAEEDDQVVAASTA